MSKIYVISDLHISSSSQNFAWLQSPDREQLLQFFSWLEQQLNKSNNVDDLLLLGDVFDNWVWPHDQKPPTLTEIISSEYASPLVDSLNKLTQRPNLRCTYVPGNHDMLINMELLGATLPQVLYSGDASTDPYYRNGRIRAEHGNALALFCSPDPLRPQNLPLGYFISRLAATADRDTGSHTPGLHTIWRELVISVKGNRLALEVIDAIANKAKVKPEDTINMPDDIWGGYSPTLREIKERYSDLYGESVMRRGESKTTIALLSEVGELQPLAVSYMEKGVTDIVVMGHTHVACSNQNLPFAHQSSVYLNSGAWCNGIGKATFVEIDKTDTSLICTVMNGASFKPSFPSITINIC